MKTAPDWEFRTAALWEPLVAQLLFPNQPLSWSEARDALGAFSAAVVQPETTFPVFLVVLGSPLCPSNMITGTDASHELDASLRTGLEPQPPVAHFAPVDHEPGRTG